MRILYVLSQFKDRDIEWIIGAGTRQDVAANEVLIRQGVDVEALFIVLEGNFAVVTGAGIELAVLQAGEFFGELSFLDSRPPVASVRALEDAVVLALPRRRLLAKFRVDTAFAARFYRALGMILADRFRQTDQPIADGGDSRLDADVEAEQEIAPDLLDGLDIAAARFQMIRERTAELRSEV